MARNPRDLERLAAEFRALTPEERAQVLSAVAANERPASCTPPKGWHPPILKGGTAWTGGSLRRQDMYGDDGR